MTNKSKTHTQFLSQGFSAYVFILMVNGLVINRA